MEKIFLLLALALGARATNEKYYSSYYGYTLNDAQVAEYIANDTLANCTQLVKDCDPNEGRRSDGSCYNLNRPEIGTVHSPVIRLLPEFYFGEGLEIRKSVTGEELPAPRILGTKLLEQGISLSSTLTQLALYYFVTLSADSVSTHDTLNYLEKTTDCCTLEGKQREECISLTIEDDDPVHRFSDVRCMNQTRPLTHYSTGCTSSIRPFSRIVNTTTQIDLGIIYFARGEDSRTYKGGQLLTEVVDNVILPTSEGLYSKVCTGNVIENGETQCFGPIRANIYPVNLFIIWFWRHHNYMAAELSKMNPHWPDEKLYQLSRDMNIAIFINIFLYELYTLLVGKGYAVKKGIISESGGYRDMNDEGESPVITIEYTYALRSMHTAVNSDLEKYDENYKLCGTERLTNLTLRVGYLANRTNIVGLTIGSLLQKCGETDSVVHPDIANLGLGGLQRSSDLTAFDMNKGRHFGIAPYIYYLFKCFGKKIEYWHQLKEFIDDEKIEELMLIYKDIHDVDLLAGIWLERLMEGGLIGPTLACIVDDQLLRFMRSDRHWYERENRPNAFTPAQLNEVRKVSVSSFLCRVGDGVRKIQPSGFIIPGPENPLIPCEEIPYIDFNAWRDSSRDE